MQLLMEERTSLTEILLLIFLFYNKIWEIVGGEKTTEKNRTGLKEALQFLPPKG